MNDSTRSPVRNTLAPFTVIEDVAPQVDGGRFAVKRVVGDEVVVTAADSRTARESRLRGALSRPGCQRVVAGRHGVPRQRPVASAIQGRSHRRLAVRRHLLDRPPRVVARGIRAARGCRGHAHRGADRRGAYRGERGECHARRAPAAHRWATKLREETEPQKLRALGMDDTLLELARIHAPRDSASQSVSYPIFVDRERARFSTWYELFPRSLGEAGRHGTFADVEKRLDDIQAMGFDVVYLPPIIPSERPNARAATTRPSPSPAMSAPMGHRRRRRRPHINPSRSRNARRFPPPRRDGEIAGHGDRADIAFQVAPDHPWVREHPAWFRKRPDGTIQYAENPPKKYEDIYPIDFDTPDWRALWIELREVFTFWMAQGVEIFRVDNPHTKPFNFWEWVIAEIRRENRA